MNLDAKTRIVQMVDALAKDGTQADRLVLARATADKFGIHGTHVDLGSESLFHDATKIVAELTHPDYDRLNGSGPGRPKSLEEANAIAESRCQKHLRRPGTVLVVEIDSKVAADKFGVYGTRRHGQEG